MTAGNIVNAAQAYRTVEQQTLDALLRIETLLAAISEKLDTPTVTTTVSAAALEVNSKQNQQQGQPRGKHRR